MNKPKSRPIIFSTPMVQAILSGQKTMTRRIVKNQDRAREIYTEDHWDIGRCPYGLVGHRLWVKETFYPYESGPDSEIMESVVLYKSDPSAWGEPSLIPWQSPLLMPRNYSRITLEITGIHVEPLQDITDEDAVREGFPALGVLPPAIAFRACWNEIHRKHPDRLWDANPWVWVLSFAAVGGRGERAALPQGLGARG